MLQLEWLSDITPPSMCHWETRWNDVSNMQGVRLVFFYWLYNQCFRYSQIFLLPVSTPYAMWSIFFKRKNTKLWRNALHCILRTVIETKHSRSSWWRQRFFVIIFSGLFQFKSLLSTIRLLYPFIKHSAEPMLSKLMPTGSNKAL